MVKGQTRSAAVRGHRVGADGTIYAGSAEGIYAVHPDGSEKWSYTAPDVNGLAIGPDGTVYYSANGGGVSAGALK